MFNILIDTPNRDQRRVRCLHRECGIGRGDGNQPILSLVADGSPGARAGLLAGDFLVEFAGEAIGPEAPIVPLREKLRGPAGSIIELKVRRGEELLTATLTLEELYPASGGCAAVERK